MSRSDPHKKKRRFAKKTILIFGEGSNEAVFLKYLRGLYARDTGFEVKILGGNGGSARDIVLDAGKVFGGYDRRVVVLDNDKPESEMGDARQVATVRGIELIEHTPCLESVLLAILDDRGKSGDNVSDQHKSEFQSKYLEKKKRGELKEYEKLFPKSLLDVRRKKIKALDNLIGVIQGK